MAWLFLFLAIISEVVATTALKACDGFTKITPSVIVVIGYITAFYFLSLAVRTIPLAYAYAIWCGLGIILIAISGLVIYGEVLRWTSVLGMLLILAGVVLLKAGDAS